MDAVAHSECRTLVIDDEPFIAGLLVTQLARLGLANVSTFTEGPRALALIESDIDSIDLVFCDLQMPQMDGIEFVRELVRVHFTGGVVLISGEDERVLESAEKLARAHGLNVLGALAKPVSLDELRTKLEGRFVSGTRAFPTSARKVYTASDLRRGIAAGELVNYYQPVRAVGSTRTVGVEALVRWNHRYDGLVTPDAFVPLAEECGLIDDLMDAVLRSALCDTRIWQQGGRALHVAVNVSVENLRSRDFPEYVASALAAAGVSPHALVLELTESRLPRDPLVLPEVLTRLRLKGVSVSIDDFGTGHSSLQQLRDLPFVELKIDRGFVHGAARDATRRAIFEASLALARQLNMRVVAEGVEDQSDWELLVDTGCDLAQGWYIAHPMPASSVPAWILGHDGAPDGRRCEDL